MVEIRQPIKQNQKHLKQNRIPPRLNRQLLRPAGEQTTDIVAVRLATVAGVRRAVRPSAKDAAGIRQPWPSGSDRRRASGVENRQSHALAERPIRTFPSTLRRGPKASVS